MRKTIDGTTYAYRLEGKGEPLVLLHGFTGSKATWDMIKPEFKDYRLLTIDLPGHGATVTKRKVSMEQFAHHLKQLTADIGFSRFHLLGYSLGGRSALSYAMYYPETIQSLILESSSPGLKTEMERSERMEQDKNLAKMLTSKGLEYFVSYWENIPLFETQRRLPKEVRHRVRKERLSQVAVGLAQSLLGMGTGAQPSWWDSLDQLYFPVLLIVGELDKKFVQINKTMNEHMKNSKLAIVQGTGHAVHLEQVEYFVKIVREHIEQSK